MARLSAHGKELARVSKETDLKEASDSLIDWERRTYALMSDGKILMKRDVQFRNPATWDHTKGKHCYGWTVWGSSKTKNAENFKAIFEKKGYTAETPR